MPQPSSPAPYPLVLPRPNCACSPFPISVPRTAQPTRPDPTRAMPRPLTGGPMPHLLVSLSPARYLSLSCSSGPMVRMSLPPQCSSSSPRPRQHNACSLLCSPSKAHSSASLPNRPRAQCSPTTLSPQRASSSPLKPTKP